MFIPSVLAFGGGGGVNPQSQSNCKHPTATTTASEGRKRGGKWGNGACEGRRSREGSVNEFFRAWDLREIELEIQWSPPLVGRFEIRK